MSNSIPSDNPLTALNSVTDPNLSAVNTTADIVGLIADQDGPMQESTRPYDTGVAGVVSGVGEYRPGIVLDKQASLDGRAHVALVGKAFCKVDAAYSPVEVGDLLTTSAMPGHAMKATDPVRAFSAVIGKALRGAYSRKWSHSYSDSPTIGVRLPRAQTGAANICPSGVECNGTLGVMNALRSPPRQRWQLYWFSDASTEGSQCEQYKSSSARKI